MGAAWQLQEKMDSWIRQRETDGVQGSQKVIRKAIQYLLTR